MENRDTKKDQFIESMVQLALRARSQPMTCNMFEKKCELLTCHQKHGCLWTKEEAEKERNNWTNGK